MVEDSSNTVMVVVVVVLLAVAIPFTVVLTIKMRARLCGGGPVVASGKVAPLDDKTATVVNVEVGEGGKKRAEPLPFY